MKIFVVLPLLILGAFCESKEWYDSLMERYHQYPTVSGIVGGQRSCPRFCPPETFCKNGKCVPFDRSFFAQKLCSTGADCGDQAVCEDGKCVVDNGNGGKCSAGGHCPNGYICVNARCVQSFHRPRSCPRRCPIGTRCMNRRCQPIRNHSSHFSFLGPKLCSTGADCGNEAVCVDGKCLVDNGNGGKCSVGAHCPNGYNCVKARCVPSSHRALASCPIRCPDGTACQGGACLPILG